MIYPESPPHTEPGAWAGLPSGRSRPVHAVDTAGEHGGAAHTHMHFEAPTFPAMPTPHRGQLRVPLTLDRPPGFILLELRPVL